MKIFGLSGTKQVGKSSMARFIRELLPFMKVEEMALAEPLKEFCINFFSVPRENVYGTDEQKNQQVFDWSLVSQDIRWKYKKEPYDPMSARELLQVIGTDIFRRGFNENIWVWLLQRRIAQSKADIVIISDVRFKNEMEAINEMGGKIVRILRNHSIANSLIHASETALDDVPNDKFDYVILPEQNTDLPILRESTVRILKAEGLI